MKKPYKLLLNSLLIFLLVVLTNMAHAQTPVGPSATAPVITTSTPPAGVSKVYCAGSTITLTGPAGYTTYQWYKVNSSGVAVLTSTTGAVYTETTSSTAAAAGYYNYQLVVINANGCSSPSSQIQVYVVPPLTVTITPSSLAVCSGTTAPTLTANPTASVVAAGYVLNYQWTDNGGLPVGTNATYTVPVTSTTTVLPLNYSVTVSYALNSSCAATDTKTITINPLPAAPTITAN